MRALICVSVSLVAILAPSSAAASELIDRNAKNIRLRVSADGKALLSYTARDPTTLLPQVNVKTDYSGGRGTFRRDDWKTIGYTCRPYDGPQLYWLVAA